MAKVTAIFKKGNKSKTENYRLISLRFICCRILEKIIRNSIVKFLEDNNFITKPNMISEKDILV